MSPGIAPQRFSINNSGISSNAEQFGPRYPRPLTRPQGRGRDYQGVATFVPLPRAVTRQVPPPEARDIDLEMPRRGLLSGLLALLRGGVPATKQLRLAETVALGEKRFVAIIHAEGHKYLVGGGASGVALLTRLDDSTKSIENPQPFKEAIEAAG